MGQPSAKRQLSMPGIRFLSKPVSHWAAMLPCCPGSRKFVFSTARLPAALTKDLHQRVAAGRLHRQRHEQALQARVDHKRPRGGVHARNVPTRG